MLKGFPDTWLACCSVPTLNGWTSGVLACAGGKGVGGVRAPRRRGGGSGKGALVAGQSKEAKHEIYSDDSPPENFFKNFPRDNKIQIDQRVGEIILSHMCWGTS